MTILRLSEMKKTTDQFLKTYVTITNILEKMNRQVASY